MSRVVRGLGITHQSFHRWREAARLPKKGYYAACEVMLLQMVGDYLAEDRSLTRAAEYIDQVLEG